MAHEVDSAGLAGGRALLGRAKEPALAEALELRQGQGHQPGGQHAHNEVGDDAHQQSEAKGENRARSGLAEDHGQDVAGAKDHHQHNSHDGRGNVAVKDSPEAALEAVFQGPVQGLAVVQLLPHPAGGDHVGVHADADGEDQARDAGQGHGKGIHAGQEAGHRREADAHLARQGDDRHHTGQAEDNDHQQGDEDEGDDAGHQHGLQGLAAQGGGQGVEVGGGEGKGQRARLDLRRQGGGALAGEVALNHALAVADHRVDRGGGKAHVVHPDGDGLAHQPLRGLGELLLALFAELQRNHILGRAGGLVLVYGGLRLHHVGPFQDNRIRRGPRGRFIDLVAVFIVVHGLIAAALPEGEHGRGGKLVNGLLRVKVRLVGLPGEAHDDPVVGLVGVELIVGDVLGDHAGLNDLLGRFQLGAGGLHPVRRAEGGLHAAPDVNAPADVAGPFDIGQLKVAVLSIYAEQGGIDQSGNENQHDKEYRFFYTPHVCAQLPFSRGPALLRGSSRNKICGPGDRKTACGSGTGFRAYCRLKLRHICQFAKAGHKIYSYRDEIPIHTKQGS